MKRIFYFTHLDVGTPEPFSTENHSSCQHGKYSVTPLNPHKGYNVIETLYYKLFYFYQVTKFIKFFHGKLINIAKFVSNLTVRI